jgi:hypothetical protein
MYFLIGTGGLILGLCNVLYKKYMNREVLQGYAFKIILFYHKFHTHMSSYIVDVYNENETIHHIVDLFSNTYLNAYSYFYNIRVLPYQTHWIANHTMYSRELRHMNFITKNTKKFFHGDIYPIVSQYDIISFNKNNNLMNTIITNKLSNYKNNEQMSSLIVKQLFVLKYDDKFFFAHTKESLYKQWTSDCQYVMNPFFSIEYEDSTGFTTEIDLPKSFFIEKNQLFSSIFMKYWLEQQMLKNDILFDNNYTLHCMDTIFNKVSIKPDQFVILEKNSYRIETIK